MKCFHPRKTRTDEFIPAWDEILLRPILTPDKNNVSLVMVSFQEEIDLKVKFTLLAIEQ